MLRWLSGKLNRFKISLFLCTVLEDKTLGMKLWEQRQKLEKYKLYTLSNALDSNTSKKITVVTKGGFAGI